MWYRHEYAGETLIKTLIHGIKNSFFTKRYLINLFHVFDPLARSNCLLLRFTNFICFLKLFFIPWELLHLPDHQLYFIIVGLFLHHINVCTEFYFQVGMVIAFQMVEMCLLGFFSVPFNFLWAFIPCIFLVGSLLDEKYIHQILWFVKNCIQSQLLSLLLCIWPCFSILLCGCS